RLAYSWVQVVGEEHRLHRSAGFHPGLLRYFNPFCVSAIFHRDDWLAVGGFDEARQAQFEDWDFWIALVGCGVRGRLIREPLLFYHRQVGSRLETGKRHALSSYKRMRTRHPRLYRGSPFLRAQRQGYYDCWAYPPLLNLSRADQYNAVISDAVAVVADGPLTEDWNAWRRQFDELPAS
ncbi:hypothetical protein JTM54_33890, partial [Pseudomonas aeruginosa]|nr:hypothetical protein [Pseudomonas aeruginosa]